MVSARTTEAVIGAWRGCGVSRDRCGSLCNMRGACARFTGVLLVLVLAFSLVPPSLAVGSVAKVPDQPQWSVIAGNAYHSAATAERCCQYDACGAQCLPACAQCFASAMTGLPVCVHAAGAHTFVIFGLKSPIPAHVPTKPPEDPAS